MTPFIFYPPLLSTELIIYSVWSRKGDISILVKYDIIILVLHGYNDLDNFFLAVHNGIKVYYYIMEVNLMKKIIMLTTIIGSLFLSASPVLADTIDINITKPANVRITDIGLLASSTIGLVLIIAGLAAFAFLIWGGIAWITSGGDKSQVEAAQKRIQAAIVGLFIVFASWALMFLLQSFFGVTIIGSGINIQTPFNNTGLPACQENAAGCTTAGKTCDTNCVPNAPIVCICR